jgi:putative SOS response-associated peptidase YedK
MCGRYMLTAPPTDLGALLPETLPVIDWPNWRPRWNIAPTQDVPVLRASGFANLRWGLVPSWTKALTGAPLINARAETLADKPSFRAAFAERRCLIPADGFYEWTTEAGRKHAHLIRLASATPFWFAGLWERWRNPAGAWLDSVAIVTTAANRDLAAIHHRMPVILTNARDATRWLDGPAAEALQPLPDGALVIRPVGPRVNAVANDDPGCLDPVAQGSLL